MRRERQTHTISFIVNDHNLRTIVRLVMEDAGNKLFEDNPAGVARTGWKPFGLGDLVIAVEKELRISARGLSNVC